jgi:hypothetical protein
MLQPVQKSKNGTTTPCQQDVKKQYGMERKRCLRYRYKKHKEFHEIL